MTNFFQEIETILHSYAEQFTPVASEPKAVIHQWIHAIVYKNELFAQNKGADKKHVIKLLKKGNCYTNLREFKKELRNVVNINPKVNPKFTFIDLFAGIGGMRQGFEAVGGSCVFSSEFDKNAQQTYFENYGEYPFGDITKIATEEVGGNWIEAIPQHDVLIGGFPCQAFSIAGYREGFKDKKGRGNLFFRMAEIIEVRQPKAFLLENVKNLAGHDKGNTLKTIEKTIKNDLGYSYIPFILNAKEYGNIPQNRERLYIVGFRGESEYLRNDNKKQSNVHTHNFKIPEPIPLEQTIHNLLQTNKQDSNFYYKNTHQYFSKLDDTMKSKDTIYQWRSGRFQGSCRLF